MYFFPDTEYLPTSNLFGNKRFEDLKVPPGNLLEKLSGDLSGKYSIRINNQWRIVFSWNENNAYEVKIIDYH